MKKKIDENRVLELHKQGLTQQKIADELGTSRGGVNNILKKHNLTESLESKMINVDEVISLHSQGYSNPEISKKTGHSRTRIYTILVERGIVGNTKDIDHTVFRKFNPTKEELINELENFTMKEISKNHGISSVTLWKRMAELDVQSPRNK